MNKVPQRVCQLCGCHPANGVTRDQLENECWYCGYCHRWHPHAIAAFLHAKRLFTAWRRRLALEQSTERNKR